MFALPVYGWLAGFLDVDGKFVTFKSRCAKRPQYGSGKDRAEARVRIEQRQVDPASGDSYESVDPLIAVAFGINLNISTHAGRQTLLDCGISEGYTRLS